MLLTKHFIRDMLRKGGFHKMLTTNGTIKKPDRRVIRTKKAILEAFYELLMKKKLSKITIKELCDIADINRKTFYTYYDSAYDLLAEIEDDIVNEVEIGIAKMKSTKSDITLRNILTCLIDMLHENSEEISKLVEIDELHGLESKAQEVIKKEILYTIDDAGAINKKNSVIFDMSIEYIISGIVSMHIDWFNTKNQLPYDVLIELSIAFADENIQTMLKFANKYD